MNNCFLCVWICRHLPLSKVGIIIFISCWVILWIAGGESGVPFRLQVDSYSPNSSTDALPIHSAGCQVKVFKVSRWLSVLWTCTVWQQGLLSWQQWLWLPLWQWHQQQQQRQSLFSFLLLILLSVYNGHVMMTMLISTLARRLSPKPTTTLQHAHNTVNDISHSECSVVIILHLPWNDILCSPKVQTGSSRLKCRNLNTKQKKSWWDSYLLFEMTFGSDFYFCRFRIQKCKIDR